MRHNMALSETNEGVRCQAQLSPLYRGFWDDVNWTVEYCPACDSIICCVEGGVHWWNYTSASPRPENLERGRALVASLKTYGPQSNP